LIASAYCRPPAHRLDTEERRTVERFLVEFEDLLIPL
jgi:4-hydroxy-tetrahydrodipicolinate synthase